MKSEARDVSGRQTRHIQLDSRQCEACWKCVEVCPQRVIGKMNFFFHKHAVFRRPEECSGCRKCVKVCEYHALAPAMPQ